MLTEKAGWGVLAQVETYPMVDIDEYRAKYGQAEGELRFRVEHAPAEILCAGEIWSCTAGPRSCSNA